MIDEKGHNAGQVYFKLSDKSRCTTEIFKCLEMSSYEGHYSLSKNDTHHSHTKIFLQETTAKQQHHNNATKRQFVRL